MNRSLARRRAALQPELAKRERRVRQAELGELAQVGRETRERTAPFQSPQGSELRPRCPARANEIRMIGVREAVRPRLCSADDGALGKGQHRPRSAGSRK
jgi:hypothetical protein